jgi:serine/threonine-protein kinase
VPIEIDVDDPARAEPASAADALAQMLSQPLAVVDLDKYEVPSRAGSSPGVRVPTPGRGPGIPPTGTAELSAMSAMKIFCDLAIAGESGLLRLENAGAPTRDLYLARGTPESVASDLPGERFSEYLVSRGVLRQDAVQAALSQLPRFGGKLSEALAGLGLLKPVDTFRLLAEMVRGRVIEMFAVTQGRASFYRGARNPDESFPLGLDPFEILGASVLALPLELLRQRFMPLLDQRPQAITPPRLDPATFQLGPTPREVWARLDGARSLRDWLAGFTSLDEQMTFLRTLHLLTESGLVRM